MWLTLPTDAFADKGKNRQMRIYQVLDFEMTQSTFPASRKIMFS